MQGPIRAAAFGDSLPLTLTGTANEALALSSLRDFGFADVSLPDVAARHHAVSQYASASAPTGSVLADVMEGQRQMIAASEPIAKLSASSDAGARSAADNAAQLFAAGLGTEIAYLMLPSFDTHTNQRDQHGDAIVGLEDVARNFFATANKLGVADSSAMIVFSEFGRRVPENGAHGTDHGHATDVMVMGPGVRGGMFGPSLDLSKLVDGNLPAAVDIRSVYASVLDGWLGTDPEPILGGNFTTLPIFGKANIPNAAPVASQPTEAPPAGTAGGTSAGSSMMVEDVLPAKGKNPVKSLLKK